MLPQKQCGACAFANIVCLFYFHFFFLVIFCCLLVCGCICVVLFYSISFERAGKIEKDFASKLSVMIIRFVVPSDVYFLSKKLSLIFCFCLFRCILHIWLNIVFFYQRLYAAFEQWKHNKTTIAIAIVFQINQKWNVVHSFTEKYR